MFKTVGSATKWLFIGSVVVWLAAQGFLMFASKAIRSGYEQSGVEAPRITGAFVKAGNWLAGELNPDQPVAGWVIAGPLAVVTIIIVLVVGARLLKPVLVIASVLLLLMALAEFGYLIPAFLKARG